MGSSCAVSPCSIFDECTHRYMLPIFILKYFRDFITAGDAGYLRNILLSTSCRDLVNASSYDPQGSAQQCVASH